MNKQTIGNVAKWSAVVIVVTGLLAAPAFAAETFGPYRATPVRVIDGDTLELNVYTWPGETHRAMVRLGGVDTPEMNAKDQCERSLAEAAKAFTNKWAATPNRFGDVPLVSVVRLHLGKYAGRYVARVENQSGADLSTALIEAGHGRPYDGGKREAWC